MFIRRPLAIAAALVALGGVAWPATAGPVAPAARHSASSKYLLNHLTVRAAHPAGYERSKFSLWASEPDGCSARYDVLIRDASRKPKVSQPGCHLSDGGWVSPYDGVATSNPTKVQIDHVVPLEQAWAAGAYRWNAATRKAYANDLGTRFDLLAVSAHSNESKGARGPDEWLPPRKSFRCRYMADYTAVLWRWHLSIDAPEKAFLAAHLATCGWPRVTEPPRPTIHLAGSGSSGGGGSGTHACRKTSSGSCIRAGEFCPKADYGKKGYDAAGDVLVCKGDSTHPRWK